MQVSTNTSKKQTSSGKSTRFQGKPSRDWKQARENKRNGF